jgi:hypothetical protein
MEDDSKKPEEALENADQKLNVPKPVKPEDLEGGVRTYATDIAEMMKREKGSIIKIALAEQERRDKFKEKLDPTATKNVVVMMLGFILIVGGIMIFIYSIVNRSKPVDVTISNVVFPSLIFTENQVQIDMTDLNKTELFNAIEAQVGNRTLVPETINNLYISYKTPVGQAAVPATVFLQKLGINVPDTLFQNLYPQFMLGVYSMEPKNNEFLIFKVKDFNDTFIAMRDWEESMLSDTLRLFKIDTSGDGKAIFSKDFETVTLFNKEARVLKNSSDKVILSYIFLDPKTVMVTTQTDAVQEVIKRLNLHNIK